MPTVSISQIDKKIIKSEHAQDSIEFLNELSSLVFQYFGEGHNRINHRDIFKAETSQKVKRFLSYSLLRVLSVNSEILINSSFKHQIIKLVEESTPEVCQQLKIDSKTETYKKENLLTNYVNTLESKISQNLNKDFDLLSINSFKNSFLGTINHRMHKVLLNDYIDYNAITKSIDKLFNLLTEYTEGDPINKYKNYNQVIKLLNKNIEVSKSTNTQYSLMYVVNNYEKIKQVLESDFANNPNSKPAELKVLKTEKKYPINKGVKHKLQLRIENNSTGIAHDTNVNINTSTNIKLNNKKNYVGQIKTYSLVNFDYEGINDAENIELSGFVEWVDFDKKKNKTDFSISLEGQTSNVNWNDIQYSEPYDLEPVTTEDEFIGRKKIIDSLRRIGKKVNSSYIFGQRRVGKTSIVKTLQSSINLDSALVIYLEAGDWNNATSAEKSMDDLGNKICRKIIRSNNKFKNIPIPDFNGSFNSITDFLDEVTELDKAFQVIIILDEFDRITNNLLYQGEIAQSFVLTIRSISNRPQFGFVLVGGEKLEYILSQWQEFNKFKPIRVDYFDRKSEWDDFNNLIKLPVKDVLEISDKAIDYLYNQTSGNPYFTKKICIELFLLMVNNRDNHATEEEAKLATEIARDSQNIGATDFSHFWKDGIKEKEEKEEQISINRRKVLLGLGQLIKSNVKTTKGQIIDKAIANGLNLLEAEKTLDEFVQRKIIRQQSDEYRFVVKFFEDWLVSNGLNKIITTFQEEQRIILRKQYEDDLRVSHKELNRLSQSWPMYKAKKISNQDIREWLDQFEDIEDQRLMFTVLENIKFYSNAEIREKMEELFGEVRKEIARNEKIVYKSEGKHKRNDIVVSYLDKNIAKSGPEYAKIFVEVNNIYKDNSTSPTKLNLKLNDLKDINALVFIDDFSGTGNSIKENIQTILDESADFLREHNIIVVVGVVTGFEEAKHRINKTLKKYNLNTKTVFLDPLNKSDKCFDISSQIFPKQIERKKAENIVQKIGVKLEKRHPLGYNDGQARVVFPNTCPNNSLPVLWKETSQWKPLFKRG